MIKVKDTVRVWSVDFECPSREQTLHASSTESAWLDRLNPIGNFRDLRIFSLLVCFLWFDHFLFMKETDAEMYFFKVSVKLLSASGLMSLEHRV